MNPSIVETLLKIENNRLATHVASDLLIRGRITAREHDTTVILLESATEHLINDLQGLVGPYVNNTGDPLR